VDETAKRVTILVDDHDRMALIGELRRQPGPYTATADDNDMHAPISPQLVADPQLSAQFAPAVYGGHRV
jgi:hypothetical protein